MLISRPLSLLDLQAITLKFEVLWTCLHRHSNQDSCTSSRVDWIWCVSLWQSPPGGYTPVWEVEEGKEGKGVQEAEGWAAWQAVQWGGCQS